MGRYTTGPPCSVGRLTANAPRCQHADRPCAQQVAQSLAAFPCRVPTLPAPGQPTGSVKNFYKVYRVHCVVFHGSTFRDLSDRPFQMHIFACATQATDARKQNNAGPLGSQ